MLDNLKKNQYFNLICLLSIIFFITVGCLILNSKFDMIDDSYYILLAKALATGQGYTEIHLPVPRAHDHFPPGLPVLLSIPTVFGFSFPTTVLLYKLMLIACGAGALFLFSRLIQAEGYSPLVQSASILLAATSIPFVGFTYRVASEMPFTLFSMLALFWFHRFQTEHQKPINGFLVLLFCGLALFTRSIGIVLIVALFSSWLLAQKHRRLVVFLVVASGIILSSLVWFGSHLPGTREYVDFFLSAYVTRDDASPLAAIMYYLRENGWLLAWRDIPRAIFSISVSEAIETNQWLKLGATPLRLGISAVVLGGLVYSLRPRIQASSLYVACSLGLIVFWPWNPARFIVPLVPFLCLFFVLGIEFLLRQISQMKPDLIRNHNQLAGLICLLCILSQIISDIRFVRTVRASGDFSIQAASLWQDTANAYQWLKTQTPEQAVIGCDPPIEAHVYLHTNRKACGLPHRAKGYHRLGITYVLKLANPVLHQADPSTSVNPQQVIDQAKQAGVQLTLAYQNQSVAVFSVAPDLIENSEFRGGRATH